MKKFFTEPDMRVIVLNFNENIAASNGKKSDVEYSGGSLSFYVDERGYIIGQGITIDDVDTLLHSDAPVTNSRGMDMGQYAWVQLIENSYNVKIIGTDCNAMV